MQLNCYPTGMQIRHSVCALDCPDACALLVHIEDGRATRLRGDPAHPVTRGFLCGKVAQYLEREYSPGRLLYPQKRTGAKGEGRFACISWDEALDTIARRLAAIAEEHGPESILPYSYAGTMGLLNNAGMDRRFFHRLGASRLDRTICSSTAGAAQNATLGLRYSTEPEQFPDAKLIIAWGANIHGTNVHLWPFIVEARRKGAKLYVIDPIKTRTAALADRYLAINPGSDLALALGLIHVIVGENLHDADYIARYTNGFDELAQLARGYDPARVAALTGIAAEDIVQLAREYAGTRPAVIRLNLGVQRSERGGAAVRAISTLPAITGSWKEVGGGLQLSTSHAFQFNTKALEMPELQERSAARPRSAHREYGGTGQGAHGTGRAAREGDGGLQFQPREHRPESGQSSRRDAPRRSVHGGARTVPDRHRGLRRYSSCPRPHFWNTPISTAPTGITICNSPAPRSTLPAKPAPTWKSSAIWRCAWASTTSASAIPKTS